MSTLTISILALVVVVVGLVIANNLWQSHRGRKARERNRLVTKGYFDPAPADAPLVPRRDNTARSGGSRWKATPDNDEVDLDRREPTLASDEIAAVVAGINRAGSGRLLHGDAAARDSDALPPLHAVPPDTTAFDDDEADDEPRRHAAGTALADDDEPRFTSRYADTGGHHVDRDSGRGEWRFDGREHATGGDDSGVPTLLEPARDAGMAVAHGAEVAADEQAAVAASDAAATMAGEQSEADAGAAVDAGRELDVDFRITLRPVQALNAERLIALTSSIRHVGGKPVRIEVDPGNGNWSPLKSGGQVHAVRLALLLANRQGPINPVELSDFTATVESLATQIKAPLQPIDMAPVLSDARELDALTAALDTQLELTVECPDSISPRGLATLARQLELQDRGNGRFAAFTEEGDPLFMMSAGESSERILFVLDVPRTSRRHNAWRAMVATASGCAQAVHGRLIDSSGRGLSVGMIEAIERQLEARYRELARVGLPAGSAVAMRVFG